VSKLIGQAVRGRYTSAAVDCACETNEATAKHSATASWARIGTTRRRDVFAAEGQGPDAATMKMRKGDRRRVTADYTGGIAALALAFAALATPTAAATIVYRVDPSRTVAEYTIVYLGVLRAQGRFAGTRGTLAIDLDAREGHVEFTIDARSVETGFAFRDAFVRDGALLDVDRHPSIGFVSTRLAFDGGRVTRIDGRLTLRGVTRSVSLHVARFDCGAPGAEAPQDCRADATAILRRSDFGMDAYAPLIGDDVTLAFEVVAHR
jgi:polyisoprenoid-binding protein YceI